MKRIEISLEQNKMREFNWGIFIPALILSILGILFIYSASKGAGNTAFLLRQSIAFGIGLFMMIITIYLPKRFFETYWFIFYIFSIILLAAVLVFGQVVYGTKGWLKYGSLSFQPAEFAKFGLILALAGFISRKGISISNIRDLFYSAILVIVPFVLIWMQPDHGTASVLLVLYLGFLFWVGFNSFFIYVILSIPLLVLFSFKGFWFYIIALVIFSLLTLFFRKKLIFTLIVIGLYISIGFITPLIYNQLQSHQKSRIDSFVNPTLDPLGTGYNVLQSTMAVGSGGLFGKGLFQGSQTQLRYIPMQWTDFIFSVPTEEWGFLGGVGVILIYMFLILKIIEVANLTDNKFNSIVCFGITIIFIYHISINIGMVIGLTPVMGLPLPFMSYGGTALIINLIFIGFVLHTHRTYVLKHNE